MWPQKPHRSFPDAAFLHIKQQLTNTHWALCSHAWSVQKTEKRDSRLAVVLSGDIQWWISAHSLTVLTWAINSPEKFSELTNVGYTGIEAEFILSSREGVYGKMLACIIYNAFYLLKRKRLPVQKNQSLFIFRPWSLYPAFNFLSQRIQTVGYLNLSYKFTFAGDSDRNLRKIS